MLNLMAFRRIHAPYMPNGDADHSNFPTLYAEGELGCAFTDQNTSKTHLRVKLDSGATANTPVGAATQGQLAFWKDQPNGLVTTDKRFCDVGESGAINRVAGIIPCAVTAGYYTDVVIFTETDYNVVTQAALKGAQVTVDTTADTNRVLYTTGVNTAPVSQVLGTFVSSDIDQTTGKCPVRVSIGFAE